MYQNDDAVNRAQTNVLVAFSAFLTLIVVLVWATDVLFVDDASREFKDVCVTFCILSGLALVPRAWQLKEDDNSEAWIHFVVATLPAIVPIVSVCFIHLVVGKDKLNEAVQRCEAVTDEAETEHTSEKQVLVNLDLEVMKGHALDRTVSLLTWKL